MTDIDIDAIRQREQAATPGPWRPHTTYPHTVWQGSDEDPYIISTTLAREVVADAEFIAHARTDVPALLAKVDELTAERDNLTAYNRSVKGANADLRTQLTAANRRADGLEADLRSAVTANTAWANENARLREVAQTYRDAMYGQHQWGGHLIEGDCPDCTKAAEEMDGDLACHRYRYWQDEYETALSTHVPAEATR